MEKIKNTTSQEPEFSGHVYIFFAFDVGDEIDLKRVKNDRIIQTEGTQQSKFLQNYHIPLTIELPHPNDSGRCINSKLHPFGVISLTYKIPLAGNFQEMKSLMVSIDEKYQEQSIQDAHSIYKKITNYIQKANFFQLKNYYTVIQIDTQRNLAGKDIQRLHGEDLASLVRFETQSLSEAQKQSILNQEIGYFSDDLVVIESEAAFVYDAQYEDLLIFFELANIQQLELHYFYTLLDAQLNAIYDQKSVKPPLFSYLPFIGSTYYDPMNEINQLQVDISVVTERFENGVRIVGEPFFANVYSQLIKKLDIRKWNEAIEKKFSIIKEMRQVHQEKVTANKDDLLTVLIIILILTELVVALIK
jgi:hypothetical protein